MSPFSHRLFPTCLAALFLVAIAVHTQAADDKDTNSLGMALRLLDGGRFIMGADAKEKGLEVAFPYSVNAQFFGNAEYPAHVTWISKPFWIGKNEVTVAQWKAFIKASGYATTAERNGKGIIGWSITPVENQLWKSHDFERKTEFIWKNPGFPQTDDHPVVGVSWDDVQAFLKWLSQKEGATYRLPTEAEWEFACRAGTTSWFSFGDDPHNLVHQHANIGNVELEKYRKRSVERQWLLDWDSAPADSFIFTAPVGRFKENAFGLQDMHGNVWEWCSDLWLDTFYKRFDAPKRNRPRKAAIDPVNKTEAQTQSNEFHTIRGGSWYNGPVLCRSSNRTAWDRDDAACYIGFRVVREANQKISTTAIDALTKEQNAKAIIEKAGGVFYSNKGLKLELHFTGENFPSAALASLEAIPELEQVLFKQKNRTVLTDADLKSLTKVASLKSLLFHGDFDVNTANLNLLAKLPGLETLEFSRSTSLNDSHLEKLANLTTLRAFQCFGNEGRLTDSGIKHLAGNRGLKRLELFETDADGSFLNNFADCPITELALTSRAKSEVKLTDANAKTLARFKNLKTLILTQQGMITDSTLLNLGTLTKLEKLQLNDCASFTANGFAPLGKLLSMRDLNLQGTVAGDEAVAALSVIPRLRFLSIGSENLTDRGFAELGKLFSLEYLHIETCVATDAGLVHLGRINRLKRLNLGGRSLTGTGLGPIAKLPELDQLRLRTPALTNIAFEHLARAKNLHKIQLAERNWEPPAALTDEGLLAIAPATWLGEIWLPRNDTGLTEVGMNALQKLMPKTNIIIYTVDWKRPDKRIK